MTATRALLGAATLSVFLALGGCGKQEVGKTGAVTPAPTQKAEAPADSAKPPADAASGVDAAKSAVAAATESAKSAAASATDTAKAAVADAADAAKSAAAGAVDAAKNTAGGAVESAQAAASGTAEAAKAAVESGKAAVADAAGAVKEAGEAAKSTAADAVDAAKSAVANAADAAKSAVAGATDSAKSAAADATDAAKQTAAKVADAATGAVDTAKATITEGAQAAKSAAADAVDAAKTAAANAADSAKTVAGQAAEAGKSAAEAVTADAAKPATGEPTTSPSAPQPAAEAPAVPNPTAAADASKTEAAAAAAGAAAAVSAAAEAAKTQSGQGSVEPPKTAPAKDGEALKVAFAYVGPVGDAGWTYAHDAARRAAEAAFAGKVQTTFVENVPENADAERVLRDLAEQGNKVIFGTTFGYMETMLKLSKEYPDIKWEHATGFKDADNMRVYDVRAYEGAYLAGIIAGKMTKSNTLGFVASIPIPEVVRNINAFTLGAQSVNADVKTKVVWINKWFDPGKEAEAAQSLINGGADVLLQNTDSSAPLQTAEKAGKFGFGWDSDMSKFGPSAHLASSIINWAPYYKKAIGEALGGQWKKENNWWGIKEGAIDLVNLSPAVPDDVKALVADKKKAIAAGSLKVWSGPMLDNDGKEVLAKDAVGDDKFISEIKFYVKGVEGKLPTGG